MEIENGKDYFMKGYKSIDKSLVKELTNTLKEDNENLELDLSLLWTLGYQKALLLNDKQNKESNAKVQSIDFDFIKGQIDIIESLNNAQQKDIHDIDIKTIIVKKIIELYTYVYNQIN